jgi:hypothetical protein
MGAAMIIRLALQCVPRGLPRSYPFSSFRVGVRGWVLDIPAAIAMPGGRARAIVNQARNSECRWWTGSGLARRRREQIILFAHPLLLSCLALGFVI